MKLTTCEIFNISTGAVSAKEFDGGVALCRFTDAQMQFYKNDNPNFYEKSFCTSGVKLNFKTDSRKFYIKINTSAVSTREYVAVDVFVNGKFYDCFKNFDEENLPDDYTFRKFGLGTFEKEFDLGVGEKEVLVHLPALQKTIIEEISLDDGASYKAVKPQKKLVAFGDSITHGYDCLHPSKRYPALIAEMLDAEEYNKGIGGEIIKPELAKLKDDFEPDYITVAYGTNDWWLKDRETFIKDTTEFYKNLSENYKSSKIFAISPIWRADIDEKTNFGPFEGISQEIEKAVKNLENVIFVEGINLVPHKCECFGDLRLHPRAEGFKHYAENLYNKIKQF